MLVSIASRFCGPATSGNGGYTAGLIADAVAALESAGSVTHAHDENLSVRLRRPPPLGVPLRVQVGTDGQFVVQGLDATGNERIADARWIRTPLDSIPPSVVPAAAAATRPRNANWSPERFGSCFVCGSARAAGDGLRISPSAVAGDAAPVPGTVATTWTPDPSLFESGFLARRFIWSALDCPGYYAIAAEQEYLLLAEMSARIHAQVLPGATLVVQAWPLGRDGRSRFAGTALYSLDGRLIGAGHTRWMAPRG